MLPLTKWYFYIPKECKLKIQGYIRQIIKANIGYPQEITQCIVAIGFVDDIFKGISKKIIDEATPLIIMNHCINDLQLLLSLREDHVTNAEILWSQEMLSSLGIIKYLSIHNKS